MEKETKKLYLKGFNPINKDSSVLNLKDNTLDFSQFEVSPIQEKHKDIFDNLLKASATLYPNKFDVFYFKKELIFLYELGDLPFYYSNHNKTYLMKGCYVGFIINPKLGCFITHMVMFRDKFSLKEYYNNMWHQTHASGSGSFVLKMCFGSNKYTDTLNICFKKQANNVQYAEILMNLNYLGDQVQYENMRSPLNLSVNKINNTAVKGVVKYRLTNFLHFDSTNIKKRKLLEKVKFTYRKGRIEWLKFNESFREMCANTTRLRSYFYEGEDYISSQNGRTIPPSKYIETYEFRGEVRDRVIYDFEDYLDDKGLSAKILNSPTRVPDLYIENTLDNITSFLNTVFLDHMLYSKPKEEITKHLARTLDELQDLKIKKHETEEDKSQKNLSKKKEYEEV